ncbi:phage minor capsid protein [Nocardioides sp. R1-1]|uniref:phage minor capsid protein n=1 Tax=Nocardioides sp. R1-1 TaxID=3383502 RepID=UPI0038D1C4CC
MPVSRLTADGLADRVAAVYADVEIRLLQLIGEALARGIDAPEWAEAKLAELQLIRRRAMAMAAQARGEAVTEMVAAMQTAYLRGVATGQVDAERLLSVDLDAPPPQAERAVAALVAAQTDALDALDLRIVRSTVDAFRGAVVKASAGTLTGGATRLQDAQRALDDLGRRGLTGFVDSAGRQWGLATYVEMSTRTTTAQAAVQGHLDRLEDAGISLFIVSDSSGECDLCRPWEGKVLSRGPVSALQRNAVTGRMERVQVDGTVREATSAGLFHPNCTHNLSGYVHGATKRGQADANPKGYADRQEQRRLERGVREWKRREAVALTPEAKRAARAKVREWQARVADHTAATGLPRKRNRESVTAAR